MLFISKQDIFLVILMLIYCHIFISQWLVIPLSLGLGDVWPHGPIRLLTGIEALNGLILIAWSASYTYSFHEKSMGGNTFEKQH